MPADPGPTPPEPVVPGVVPPAGAPPSAPEPDEKDWTWVLDAACPECGYDARAVAAAQVPALIRANAAAWVDALGGPDVRNRPEPTVWSVLEYACHVRDVNLLFDERATRMLTEDDPLFANWDQDATAIEQRYDLQDPRHVARQVVDAAEAVAARYAGVSGEAWQRPGRRSNGSVFTVDTLARYHVHDVVHHLWDVQRSRAAGGAAAESGS